MKDLLKKLLKLVYFTTFTVLLPTHIIAMERDLKEVQDWEKSQSTQTTPTSQEHTETFTTAELDTKGSLNKEEGKQEIEKSSGTSTVPDGGYFSLLEDPLLGLIFEFSRTGDIVDTDTLSTMTTSQNTTNLTPLYYHPAEAGRTLYTSYKTLVNHYRSVPTLSFADPRNDPNAACHGIFIASLYHFRTVLSLTCVSQEFRKRILDQDRLHEARADFICGLAPLALLSACFGENTLTLRSMRHFFSLFPIDFFQRIKKENADIFVRFLIQPRLLWETWPEKQQKEDVKAVLEKRAAELGNLKVRSDLFLQILASGNHLAAIELASKNNFEVLHFNESYWALIFARYVGSNLCNFLEDLPHEHGAHVAYHIVANCKRTIVNSNVQAMLDATIYLEETLTKLSIQKGLKLAKDIDALGFDPYTLEMPGMREAFEKIKRLARVYLLNNSLLFDRHR
ncbi:MAG: hypothetical protein FJX71_04045 [Alphaproteobacteria bacterium]|nr:hypothetical protein [Alphaproteobacteria bacterium]